jgi:hypothetical protein
MTAPPLDPSPFQADFGDDPTNGIFRRLHDMAQGNPADRGLVAILPSDRICDSFANVILPNWRQHWFSFHPNPSIAFDFHPHSVHVTAYSLRTYSGGVNCGHLRSWVFEGSNDNVTFAALDTQTDSAALNGSGLIALFPIANPGQFRTVRLRLSGVNHAGSDFLVLRGIELFGGFT